MKAYSIDLRERIVHSVQAGRSQLETARIFGIGVSSVKRYLQQQRQRGTLAPKPIPGAQRHIGPEQEDALRAQLTAHPDATLEHHCAWWEEAHGQQVSIATMSRALRRLRWTHKKSHSQPANETKRLGKPGARR
jgi:transposase